MTSDIKPGYTRVSEILSQWDRFGGIKREILEAKIQVGISIHNAIHAESKDMYISVKPERKGYMESFYKWRDLTNAEFVEDANELRLYCDKLMITGCVDAVMKMKGSNKLFIVDFKTSASVDRKIWALQGQFYHYLALQNGYDLEDRFIFLQLHKDGTTARCEEFDVTRVQLGLCMSALSLYRYLHLKKKPVDSNQPELI
jgi:hypothetical protein